MTSEALVLILDRIADHVARYVVADRDQLVALALWVAHTHAIEAAEVTPYIAVTSAEKRSGKTLLQSVMAPLVARPLPTANATVAAIFRSLTEQPPATLLWDEVDTSLHGRTPDAEERRGIVNAGYERGQSVLRCVGEGAKQRVERFQVFGPKMLSGIGNLPGTIADRSIPIRLRRRAPHEEIERHRRREVLPIAESIRENLITWADHEPTIERLTAARPEIPTS